MGPGDRPPCTHSCPYPSASSPAHMRTRTQHEHGRTRLHTLTHRCAQTRMHALARGQGRLGSGSRQTRRRWAALRTQATFSLCDGDRLPGGGMRVGQGPRRGTSWERRSPVLVGPGAGGRARAVRGWDICVQPHPGLAPFLLPHGLSLGEGPALFPSSPPPGALRVAGWGRWGGGRRPSPLQRC